MSVFFYNFVSHLQSLVTSHLTRIATHRHSSCLFSSVAASQLLPLQYRANLPRGKFDPHPAADWCMPTSWVLRLSEKLERLRGTAGKYYSEVACEQIAIRAGHVSSSYWIADSKKAFVLLFKGKKNSSLFAGCFVLFLIFASLIENDLAKI